MKPITFLDGSWVNDFCSYDGAVRLIADRIREQEFCVVNFMYFSSFVIQRKVSSYRKALLSSDFILLDGVGMMTYTKLIHGKENVLNLNGTDFVPNVLHNINTSDPPVSVALYGASSAVIEKAYTHLADKYRTIDFYYYQNGYEDLDFSALKQGSTLLIGLGTPKQEYFVYRNRDFFRENRITVMTIGGLFDFVSGYAKRAPECLRKWKMEWAYRMIHNPKRHVSKNVRNLHFFPLLVSDYLASRNTGAKT